MIKNSTDMVNSMSEINDSYARDLQAIVKKVVDFNLEQEEIKNPPAPKSIKEKKAEQRDRFRKNARKRKQKNEMEISHEEEKETEEDSPLQEPEIEKIKSPKWAKNLYREIMKVCHPDTFRKNTPASEQAIKISVLQDTMKFYKTSKWAGLIYCAALVNVYTGSVSGTKQIQMVNSLYGENTKVINSIQQTASWVWGSSWETIEQRITILSQTLAAMNIAVPPRANLLEIVVLHEGKIN